MAGKAKNSCFSTEWTGEWEGNSHPLTVTGLWEGSGQIEVYIKDKSTGQYCASVLIHVTVSGQVAEPSEEIGSAEEENTASILECTIRLGAVSYLYNGSYRKPSVSVKKGEWVLQEGKDYEVSYLNNKNAGTASVKITGTGAYSGTATKEFTIRKAAQKLRLQTTGKVFRYKALQNKEKSFKIRVKSAKGKISYRCATRYLSVSDGKVRIKRGIPRGSYKITVKAAGNQNYKPSSKTVRIVVR